MSYEDQLRPAAAFRCCAGFAIYQAEKGTLMIIKEGESSRSEEELPSGVLRMRTVFLSRLYGSRSQQCWKPVDGVCMA